MKNAVLFPSDLHDFWWEIYCYSYYWSPMGNTSFLSSYLQDFCLFSVYRSLIKMYLGKDLFVFIPLGVCSASWTWGFMLVTWFGKFSASNSTNAFSAFTHLFRGSLLTSWLIILFQPPAVAEVTASMVSHFCGMILGTVFGISLYSLRL